ncbi:hypothetical protein [Stenotrophomonas phage CM2]
MIGVKVANQDENGKQYRISGAGGHFGSRFRRRHEFRPTRLPKPGTIALLEFKTHGNQELHLGLAGSSWTNYADVFVAGREGHFNGKGVKEAKPEHYVQMQCCYEEDGLSGVPVCCGVQGNRCCLTWSLFHWTMATGRTPSRSGRSGWLPNEEPPRRIGNSPGFYGCKFCEHEAGVPQDRAAACQKLPDVRTRCSYRG